LPSQKQKSDAIGPLGLSFFFFFFSAFFAGVVLRIHSQRPITVSFISTHLPFTHMTDVNHTLANLVSVFPHLDQGELLKVVNRVGLDLEACCEYIVNHADPNPGRTKLLASNDPKVPKHGQQSSEEEAKSIAMIDYLVYQDQLLKKAQEDQLSQSLIEAMRLEEQEEQARQEERRRAELATMEMLETERLERQAILEAMKYECPICASDWTIQEMYTVDGCDHRICLECMKNYVETKISTRDVKNIPCPMGPNCPEQVSFDQVRHVLPWELFERFDVMLLDVTLESDPNCRFCPRPGCGTAMMGDPHRPMMNCPRPGCNFAYCFNCREAWHADTTCALYQEWKAENNGADAKFGNWAAANAKPCPKCSVLINKDGGCNHMKCTRCKADFCWQCLGDYHASRHACAQFS
jgi:hypothetical protein